MQDDLPKRAVIRTRRWLTESGDHSSVIPLRPRYSLPCPGGLWRAGQTTAAESCGQAGFSLPDQRRPARRFSSETRKGYRRIRRSINSREGQDTKPHHRSCRNFLGEEQHKTTPHITFLHHNKNTPSPLADRAKPAAPIRSPARFMA